jgi:choline dehydrogenase-like flavoprotein
VQPDSVCDPDGGSDDVPAGIAMAFVGHIAEPYTEFLGAIYLLMNPQSKGPVRLHSKDPSAAPLIDPSFLNNTFDRQVLIEGMKVTKRLLSAPVYAEKTLKTYMPADDSDEAIWARTELDDAHGSMILIRCNRIIFAPILRAYGTCRAPRRWAEALSMPVSTRAFGYLV